MEATEESKKKFELIRSVSRRLLIALIVTFVISGAILVLSLKYGEVPTFMAVFAFGVFGGFVSIQRRLLRLDEFNLSLLASSWWYPLLAPMVGGLLACLLYILFISKLVTGELFPAFNSPPATNDPNISFKYLLEVTGKETEDYAKLLFWSFLAGFSEKFVTNILGQFEASAQKETQPHNTTPPGSPKVEEQSATQEEQKQPAPKEEVERSPPAGSKKTTAKKDTGKR